MPNQMTGPIGGEQTAANRKVPTMREIGVTGLKQYSGYVREEFLRELRGPKFIKTIKEMMTDPIIGSFLFAVEMFFRSVKFTVEPFDKNDPQSVEDAEFITTCLHDMRQSWNETIIDILSFIPFGWSTHEIVYKRRQGYSADYTRSSKYTDNKIGWAGFPIRSQDSLLNWELTEAGQILGFWQMPPTSGKTVHIPFEKFLLFRSSFHKNNPEGKSAIRNCYRSWYYKTRWQEIEAIGGERYLAGIPIMLVPSEIMDPNATADEQSLYSEAKKIVRNIRNDEQMGVVLPSDRDEQGNPLYDLKLLSSNNTSPFDTNTIIKRYNAEIAMTVLADFVLLGHEKVGSFALSDSKTEMFTVVLSGWTDSILEPMNKDGIPRLMELNGRDPARTPKIRHGEFERKSLAKFTEAIQRLAQSGMPLFPDDELEGKLRAMLDLDPIPQRDGMPDLGSENAFNDLEPDGGDSK